MAEVRNGANNNGTNHSSLELDFDEAVLDSPIFRASIQMNEDQLEQLSVLLETINKTSRICFEHANSMSHPAI